MKKRFLSILMVAILLLLTASCAAAPTTTSPSTTGTTAPNGTTTGASETSAETSINADGLGGYKIGFWYAPPTDPLSKGFRDTLDYCAELTNCEMVYYDMTDWSANSQAAAVESLVSQGCDAIIMVVGSSPSMYQYMIDNKVYYVGMTRSYTAEVAALSDPSEYATGWVGDLGGESGANFKTGYDIAKTLADSGCKNIAYLESSEGETMGDERAQGIEAAAAEFGMNIVTSYRGNQWGTALADILATFGSQLDGIVYAGGAGEDAIAAINTAGYLGKIKLAQGNSAGPNTREYLEQGILTVTSMGGTAFMIPMYMQLFNALSGADRLFDTGSKLFPTMGALMITTPEQYDMAVSIFTDMPVGMSPSSVLKLNSLCAPGMSVAEREALALSYATPEFLNVDNLRQQADEYLEYLNSK